MKTLHTTQTRLPGAELVDPRSGLSPSQLAALKQRLEAEHDSLRAAAQTRRRSLAQRTAEAGDEVDDAAWNLDQHLALRFGESERKLLDEVEHALDKLEAGDYGLCEDSDEPIGFARLSLRPWARYSVATQERLERAARELALVG